MLPSSYDTQQSSGFACRCCEIWVSQRPGYRTACWRCGTRMTFCHQKLFQVSRQRRRLQAQVLKACEQVSRAPVFSLHTPVLNVRCLCTPFGAFVNYALTSSDASEHTNLHPLSPVLQPHVVFRFKHGPASFVVHFSRLA